MLEEFSVARARKAIRSVLNLTPQTANKIIEGSKTVLVKIEQVELDDVLLVKSGERIPVDGEVLKGNSFVNQAPLTGESVAVEKTVGDKVFAGTINESGVLEIKVMAAYTDSKVSKITRMIEESQNAKAPSERFVDSFAKIYTPVVFALALLTLLVPPLVMGESWDTWIYRSLVLLVIACPCALVISTPIAIVSGLTAMARKGVLVKGGVVLEALGRLRAIAVDKTGTITEGKPTVQKFMELEKFKGQVLPIAAAIEKMSSHPLAQAVVSYAESQKVVSQVAYDFRNLVGRGAEAKIDGHIYFLGNHRFAHELNICTPQIEKTLSEFEEKALTVVVVGHRPHDGCEGEVMGILGLGDTLRSNAKQAVDHLHQAGLKHVIMLSGDNQKTASVIAKSVGIDEAKGNLLPEDKVNEIKRLRQEFQTVAMIGDGINDAPALAEATVGIAMGAAGSDAAIETADVALMRDDLEQVAAAVDLGKRTLKIIKFNVAFAILLKLVFLVMAILGRSNLWVAVAADTGASILVILNSLRLLRFK